MSRVEDEWHEEAWRYWLRSDLLRTLDAHVRDVVEDDEDLLRNAYRHAMEKENEYPTYDENSANVNVKRIADSFGDLIRDEVWNRVNALWTLTDEPDDAELLVASDYCEEHGREDLAGFLRGEVEAE